MICFCLFSPEAVEVKYIWNHTEHLEWRYLFTELWSCLSGSDRSGIGGTLKVDYNDFRACLFTPTLNYYLAWSDYFGWNNHWIYHCICSWVTFLLLLQLVNCGLSADTLGALKARGITALFPIQKHVFEPAMGGKDLICRAKTGSGKTLAFAIPVIESLLKVWMSFCAWYILGCPLFQKSSSFFFLWEG